MMHHYYGKCLVHCEHDDIFNMSSTMRRVPFSSSSSQQNKVLGLVIVAKKDEVGDGENKEMKEKLVGGK
jgi:hypothetical protein